MFDNVILENKIGYIYGDNSINYNSGKIFNDDKLHFVYRNVCQYSNEMHLSLGKVCYSIDWKELKISNIINIPVAIKFEIGELQVNMTREMLIYSDETKNLIKERINIVLDELANLYNERNEPQTSLFEYIVLKKQYEENKKFILNIEIEDISFNLDLTQIKDKLNTLKFKPISHLPIQVASKVNPLFFLYSSTMVENRKEKKNGIGLTKIHNNSNLSIVLIKNKEPESKEFRKYIENCYYIKQTKISFKKQYNEFIENLSIKYDNSVSVRGIRKEGYPNQLGIAKIIIEYRNIILEELKKECNKFIDYDNFKIPQEWIDEQKRITKENKIQKVKVSGIISARNITTETQVDLDLSTLNNFTGFIVLGYLEDKDDLIKINKILLKNYYHSYKRENKLNYKERFRVYRIAKNNVSYFYNTPFRVYHVSKFMEIQLFKRLVTSLFIRENINVNEFKQGEVKLFNTHIANILKDIGQYNNENSVKDENIRNSLKELITKFSNNKEQNLAIDNIVRWKLNQIDEYFKGAELSRYVKINEESLPYLVDYLKIKKKRVNLNFYDNSKQIQQREINKEQKFSFGVELIERKEENLLQYNENLPKLAQIC